jgi:hypothetical protein
VATTVVLRTALARIDRSRALKRKPQRLFEILATLLRPDPLWFP